MALWACRPLASHGSFSSTFHIIPGLKPWANMRRPFRAWEEAYRSRLNAYSFGTSYRTIHAVIRQEQDRSSNRE